MQTPQQAYDFVLLYAGAAFPKRDTVDGRIVYETRTGTVTYGGKTYAKAQGFDTTKVYGIIDSQMEVGGWPTLNSFVPLIDSDHDGMPDDWEQSHGLNPANAADRNLVGENGYTMLENYLNELVGSDPSTTTAVSRNNPVPVRFALDQNYPNPFNPSTTISYKISSDSYVTLKVYDILGKEIATLVNGQRATGSYQTAFDASLLSSGMYFYQLRAGEYVQTRKMVLMK
jgi:hypothetical protein